MRSIVLESSVWIVLFSEPTSTSTRSCMREDSSDSDICCGGGQLCVGGLALVLCDEALLGLADRAL